MRLGIKVDLDYHFSDATDVLLAIEVAQLPDQELREDLLTVSGSGPLRPVAAEDGIGRRTWLRHVRSRLGCTSWRRATAVTSAPASIGLPLPRWALASSSTAVVTIGGALSMPSFFNGESGVGFTSACEKPP